MTLGVSDRILLPVDSAVEEFERCAGLGLKGVTDMPAFAARILTLFGDVLREKAEHFCAGTDHPETHPAMIGSDQRLEILQGLAGFIDVSTSNFTGIVEKRIEAVIEAMKVLLVVYKAERDKQGVVALTHRFTRPVRTGGADYALSQFDHSYQTAELSRRLEELRLKRQEIEEMLEMRRQNGVLYPRARAKFQAEAEEFTALVNTYRGCTERLASHAQVELFNILLQRLALAETADRRALLQLLVPKIRENANNYTALKAIIREIAQ